MNTRQFIFALSVALVVLGLAAILMVAWWYYSNSLRSPIDQDYSDSFDTTMPENQRQRTVLDVLDGADKGITNQEERDEMIQRLEALSNQSSQTGEVQQDTSSEVTESESKQVTDPRKRYIDAGGAVPQLAPGASTDPSPEEEARMDILEALSQ